MGVAAERPIGDGQARLGQVLRVHLRGPGELAGNDGDGRPQGFVHSGGGEHVRFPALQVGSVEHGTRHVGTGGPREHQTQRLKDVKGEVVGHFVQDHGAKHRRVAHRQRIGELERAGRQLCLAAMSHVEARRGCTERPNVGATIVAYCRGPAPHASTA